MNVTVERIPDSQVLLTIEVDPDRVRSSVDQAYRRLAPRTRIPGFRPGKAPRALVEQHYGRDMFLNEALDRLLPEVVEEAIRSESIEIIDRPSLEIASVDPVVVKARVPVRPTVDLGDYRSLRLERAQPEVDEAAVAEQIEALRRRYATVEPVERAAADGDVVRVALRVESDGATVIDEDDTDLTVTEEALRSLPGLHPLLVGMSAGETRTGEQPVDADDEAGVPAHTLAYTVTVKDVKAQVLPELDDDFAKEVGEGFPTFAALRERVENDIRSRREKEIDREYDQEAVQKLVENATIEFPPHLVAREVERLMHEQFIPNDDHKAFERMLRAAGVSEDRLRAGLEPAATERVKRGLVLSRLRELESLTVPDELVTAELERMIADSPQPDEYRSAFDTAYGRDLIANRLLTERILERLRLIMRGEAPELEIPPSEDAPAGEAAETPDTAEKTE